MNRFISKALIASAMALSFVLIGCEEDDDPVSPGTNDAVAPAAVSDLQATSINATTIAVRFADSAARASAGFNGYNVSVTGTGLDTTFTISATATGTPNTINIDGLTEGTVYTVGVQSRATGSNGDADTAVSASTPTVMWAPAKRYTETYKLYSSQNSEFGSGINLGSGEVLKIANGGQWDICFDDKDGRFLIGSPGVSGYVDANFRFSNGEAARIVFIGREYQGIASLDELFDSRALSPQAGEDFAENLIDLASVADKTQNFVFTAITQTDAAQDARNYAKVLVKAVGGSFVQGTGADAFVEVEVSYQSIPDVAYAGIKPFLKGRTVSAK